MYGFVWKDGTGCRKILTITIIIITIIINIIIISISIIIITRASLSVSLIFNQIWFSPDSQFKWPMNWWYPPFSRLYCIYNIKLLNIHISHRKSHETQGIPWNTQDVYSNSPQVPPFFNQHLLLSWSPRTALALTSRVEPRVVPNLDPQTIPNWWLLSILSRELHGFGGVSIYSKFDIYPWW